MRGSIIMAFSLSLVALGCQPKGPTDAPRTSADRSEAEPLADTPAVFAEVETLPRDETTAGTTSKPNGPGVELDWQAVDPSLSGMVNGPRKRVDYDSAHPWVGAAQPLVTAVVFVDYQCPFCANADHELAELVAAYPQDLRVVTRMMPLAMHEDARGASLAALAAHNQGQFEAMHELLFANPGALGRPELESYAIQLGLDRQRFATDLDDPALAERLTLDRSLADAVGVQGVPTIYLNGIEVIDTNTLDSMIRQELALAQAMIDAGAPRREVWARMMAASEAP